MSVAGGVRPAATGAAQIPGLWPDGSHTLRGPLEAAGLRVITDIRRIQPPVVLLLPSRVTRDAPGVLTVRYEVTAIGPGTDSGDSIKWLWTAAAPAMSLICDTVEFTTYQDWPAVVGDAEYAVTDPSC
jgi:hypothetical protein